MSLWERQRGEDKIIGRGAPPSPCKQGWDSSTWPESKHKYLFLLGSHWRRLWNQDTTQAAQRLRVPLTLEDGAERGPQGFCGCCFCQHSPPCALLTPPHQFMRPPSCLLLLFFSVWLDLPFQSVQLILPQRASILSWEEAASPAL